MVSSSLPVSSSGSIQCFLVLCLQIKILYSLFTADFCFKVNKKKTTKKEINIKKWVTKCSLLGLHRHFRMVKQNTSSPKLSQTNLLLQWTCCQPVATAKQQLPLPSYLHELLPSTFFTVSLRVLTTAATGRARKDRKKSDRSKRKTEAEKMFYS